MLDVVVRREADADSDRALDPVHAQTLVEALDEPFLPAWDKRECELVFSFVAALPRERYRM